MDDSLTIAAGNYILELISAVKHTIRINCMRVSIWLKELKFFNL